MGKKGAWVCDDLLDESLVAELRADRPSLRRLKTRSIGFLQVVIAIVALVLGLGSTVPEAIPALIAGSILVAYFAAPAALMARRIVVSLEAQAQPLSAADRLAAFLCVSLFTVPISLAGLVYFCVRFLDD
jgi:hypothetical protein